MQRRQLNNSRRGMTLVELLVVVAIMVLLLAISVPFLRPMLETRKTSHAAQVLAGAFQQARIKSIQEGVSYGVRLIPFESAPTTAVQLRIEKRNLPPDFFNPLDVRVRVDNGEIVPYRFSDDEWKKATWNDVPDERTHFQQGYAVQFNHLGRFLRSVKEGDTFKLLPPYGELTLPEFDFETIADAMEYRISRVPFAGSSWIAPVPMPRGTVVDLAFSGGETVGFGGGEKTREGAPPCFAPGDEVFVTFSPAGNVDVLYIYGQEIAGKPGKTEIVKINELLYFCVGEWDRQVDAAGKSLAEDGRTNLAVPSTYWVTLHPKTGGTRITENAPIKSKSDPIEALREARKFAREHFFNVGGM
jgi:prepilin-type N-terminal cleavage/methylation domain-containing protein